MKIVAIETHFSRVPCDIGAARTAFVGVGWSSLDTLLVRVVTDQGLEGTPAGQRPALSSIHPATVR
jgi:D-galactarolactone cycloisomerase